MKQLRFFLLISLLATALPAILNSQTTPTNSTPSASTGSSPVQEIKPPEGTILRYAPPPAEFARAKAYSHAHYRHFFINTLYGLLLLLVILRWRLAPKFRDLAERVSARRGVQLVIFAPLILLTIAILGIPPDIWDQSLDRAYGLSVQGWGAWLGDWALSHALMLIVETLLVGILYAVIRRSPRRWWFYFWLASIPILLALFFLQPIVIDPLFYTFKPLESVQPVLLAEMQKVVHRGGMDIPPDRMFVMNASSKQTGLNAYVTGFGASKRVVVWDNTIAKATIPETLFVFGHEMGHYVLHAHSERNCHRRDHSTFPFVHRLPALKLDAGAVGNAVEHSIAARLGVAASFALFNHSLSFFRHPRLQCGQPPF